MNNVSFDQDAWDLINKKTMKLIKERDALKAALEIIANDRYHVEQYGLNWQGYQIFAQKVLTGLEPEEKD